MKYACLSPDKLISIVDGEEGPLCRSVDGSDGEGRSSGLKQLNDADMH